MKEESLKLGFRKILKKTFRLPNGVVSEYDIKHEGPAVCIFALTRDKYVVLAKQYRPGLEEVLFEMPGGGVDHGESCEDAAQRELREETGYTGDFEFIGTSYDCAYSTMIRYNFVCTNCHKVQEQNLDESEFIEVVKMSLNDFRKHLQSGKLTDIESGYLALDHLGFL